MRRRDPWEVVQRAVISLNDAVALLGEQDLGAYDRLGAAIQPFLREWRRETLRRQRELEEVAGKTEVRNG